MGSRSIVYCLHCATLNPKNPASGARETTRTRRRSRFPHPRLHPPPSAAARRPALTNPEGGGAGVAGDLEGGLSRTRTPAANPLQTHPSTETVSIRLEWGGYEARKQRGTTREREGGIRRTADWSCGWRSAASRLLRSTECGLNGTEPPHGHGTVRYGAVRARYSQRPGSRSPMDSGARERRYSPTARSTGRIRAASGADPENDPQLPRRVSQISFYIVHKSEFH